MESFSSSSVQSGFPNVTQVFAFVRVCLQTSLGGGLSSLGTN